MILAVDALCCSNWGRILDQILLVEQIVPEFELEDVAVMVENLLDCLADPTYHKLTTKQKEHVDDCYRFGGVAETLMPTTMQLCCYCEAQTRKADPIPMAFGVQSD